MKKFVKTFAYVIIFTLFGAVILRCALVADKSVFAKPVMTEAMAEVYTDDAAEGFIKTVDVAAEMSDRGYFCAYGFYYTPAASQAQVTVRWNDSVYERYRVLEPGTDFTFELVNETTGERYSARAEEAKDRVMYQFRRLIADGVTFGPDDQIVIAAICRDGSEDTQVLCYAEQPLADYKLSEKQKTALLEE